MNNLCRSVIWRRYTHTQPTVVFYKNYAAIRCNSASHTDMLLNGCVPCAWQWMCPLCLAMVHKPLELPRRAVCLVQWLKASKQGHMSMLYHGHSSGSFTTETSTTQIILQDIVVQCHTCGKDVQGQ